MKVYNSLEVSCWGSCALYKKMGLCVQSYPSWGYFEHRTLKTFVQSMDTQWVTLNTTIVADMLTQITLKYFFNKKKITSTK